MWTCACGLQGVGECASLRERIPRYIKALTDKTKDPASFKTSIERHFATDHSSVDDVHLCIVDGVGVAARRKPYIVPTLRKRLENRWIHRLDAQLNRNRYLGHSFSGHSSARTKE